jgi:hypothetical protein
MPTAPILPLSVPRTSTIGGNNFFLFEWWNICIYLSFFCYKESSEQAEEIEPLLAGTYHK